uniref:Uncharacterized protein n=1 Tax=Heterorhabditis bacteriophora TaxID=37862 RepID=A0A1I7WWQ1_HETBA
MSLSTDMDVTFDVRQSMALVMNITPTTSEKYCFYHLLHSYTFCKIILIFNFF